ncbi:MAG: hypothetical protein RLO08_18895 [Parvibaculaceae bacterium]
MMAKWTAGVAALSLVLANATNASAASNYTSAYSDLDFDKCTVVEEDSEFGFVRMKCPGAFGYDVHATEADLRLYLAYAPEGIDPFAVTEPENGEEAELEEEPAPEPSIGQTIAPFNTLGPKLEWRAPNTGSDAEPFATIVRYTYQTMNDDGSFGEGQVLVVSRFRDGASCHVAYIDALANANANVMAREVADKYASGGSCPEGGVPVLGRGGESF